MRETKKKRKSRSDSVQEQVKSMQDNMRDVKVPGHVRLEKKEMPYWNSIIAEHPKSEWTLHRLELAAFLAKSLSSLEDCYQVLLKEGIIIETKNSQNDIVKKANPVKCLIELFTKQALSLRRSLGIHARAQMGEARDIARQRQKNFCEEDFDDPYDLIAKPPKNMQ